MRKYDELFYKDQVNTLPFMKLMGMKLVSPAGALRPEREGERSAEASAPRPARPAPFRTQGK